MKYKGFTIDDNKIDKYVDELECSIAEACELILEENGKIEESEDTRKAIAETTKNAPRRYEKGGNRKKTERCARLMKLKNTCSDVLKHSLKGSEQPKPQPKQKLNSRSILRVNGIRSNSRSIDPLKNRGFLHIM